MIDYKERCRILASIIYGMIQGDDPEHAANMLTLYGYLDEDYGEWCYEDDEEKEGE